MDEKEADNADTIEKILARALGRLCRMDSYEEFRDYIRSEWYSSILDLQLALDDGKAWTDLNLPSRLKLELKSELLAIQAAAKGGQVRPTTGTATSIAKTLSSKSQTPASSRQQWAKYYSEEDGAYYFYNIDTQATQWELPTGDNVDIYEDYGSNEPSPAHAAFESQELARKDKVSQCKSGKPAKGKSDRRKQVAAIDEDDNVSDDDNDDDDEEMNDVTVDDLLETLTETEEELIWKALLRSQQSKRLVSAEPVGGNNDGSRTKGRMASPANRPDIIIVNEAYAIPEEVSMGVVESAIPVPVSPSAPAAPSDLSALHGTTAADSISRNRTPTSSSSYSSHMDRAGREMNRLNPNSGSADSRDSAEIHSMSAAVLESTDGSGSFVPDPLMAQRLIDMGFSPNDVASALKRSNNNLSTAASILLAKRRPSFRETTPVEFTPPNQPQTQSPSRTPSSSSSNPLRRFNFNRIFPPPPPPSASL